jgi:hypothetical protein
MFKLHMFQPQETWSRDEPHPQIEQRANIEGDPAPFLDPQRIKLPQKTTPDPYQLASR